ncbi:MAG TPA: DNA repair protein RecO [Chloroflexota bacterium]|nr:DNA repair protein RecO [Chloroflexota bacterium]
MRLERVYRTAAVVLRRQDFGEADRVLTCYSPTHGKFRALAKGVRRPQSRLGGHVEQFTHVNLLVALGRNLDIVTQAETIRPYAHLRDDLWKAAYACYAAELVDRMTEERLENRPVFDLFLELLAYLDGMTGSAEPGEVREAPGGPAAPVELAVRTFELQLLGRLGYAPELYHCVQCGETLRPEEIRFSPSGGGTLCRACWPTHPGARPLSVTAIKAMRLMSQGPYRTFERLRLPAETGQEIEGALRAHVGYILERQLRTSEFLDRLKADRKRQPRKPAPPAPAPAASAP